MNINAFLVVKLYVALTCTLFDPYFLFLNWIAMEFPVLYNGCWKWINCPLYSSWIFWAVFVPLLMPTFYLSFHHDSCMSDAQNSWRLETSAPKAFSLRPLLEMTLHSEHTSSWYWMTSVSSCWLHTGPPLWCLLLFFPSSKLKSRSLLFIPFYPHFAIHSRFLGYFCQILHPFTSIFQQPHVAVDLISLMTLYHLVIRIGKKLVNWRLLNMACTIGKLNTLWCYMEMCIFSSMHMVSGYFSIYWALDP